MRIGAKYSHLNGEEYLLVHKPTLWQEIQKVISDVDAAACKTKVSKEKTMRGKLLYSPTDMNAKFKLGLEATGWTERRNTFWVTDDEKLLRGIHMLSAQEQKLVSCVTNTCAFRGRSARHYKAWPAGNIRHIAKGHNAVVARRAASRRARATGPVAALRPLARGPAIPGGPRLATDPVAHAESTGICDTGH